MSNEFDDPALILERRQDFDARMEIHRRRRTTGCYTCLHSKYDKISTCTWEIKGYPDMSNIEDDDNYCREWRNRHGQ